MQCFVLTVFLSWFELLLTLHLLFFQRYISQMWKRFSGWTRCILNKVISLYININQLNVVLVFLDDLIFELRIWPGYWFIVFWVWWCDQVLEQAWPFIGMYVEKLLRESIQPAVRISNSALKMFTFTKIHFGHKVSQQSLLICVF